MTAVIEEFSIKLISIWINESSYVALSYVRWLVARKTTLIWVKAKLASLDYNFILANKYTCVC